MITNAKQAQQSEAQLTKLRGRLSDLTRRSDELRGDLTDAIMRGVKPDKLLGEKSKVDIEIDATRSAAVSLEGELIAYQAVVGERDRRAALAHLQALSAEGVLLMDEAAAKQREVHAVYDQIDRVRREMGKVRVQCARLGVPAGNNPQPHYPNVYRRLPLRLGSAIEPTTNVRPLNTARLQVVDGDDERDLTFQEMA